MRAIGIVFRKELYRVFSDKKMIFGLFILPALLVVGMYGLIGILAVSMMNDQQAHEATVIVRHAPESFQTYLAAYLQSDDAHSFYEINGTRYQITWQDDAEADSDEQTALAKESEAMNTAKDQIYTGDLDLLIVFPESFEQTVGDYTVGDSVPDVQTFYNPSEDYSDNARSDFLNGILEPYRNRLLEQRLGSLDQIKIFTVDETNDHSVIQNDNRAQGKTLGYAIPYMITVLLFAGAMNLGADSFAGEKERGTIAAMLVTPVKRSYIVYGKLFALMVLSGLSALVYGGAMIFAMPMVYRTLGAMTGQELRFTPGQMAMLLGLIVTLVFLYVALIAVCATMAKNMKEGSTYIMPAYMVVMVIGILSMFQGEKVTTLQYLIPLYGPTIALKNIFTCDITGMGFVMAILSNLIVGISCALLTARMFRSEKIMFDA